MKKDTWVFLIMGVVALYAAFSTMSINESSWVGSCKECSKDGQTTTCLKSNGQTLTYEDYCTGFQPSAEQRSYECRVEGIDGQAVYLRKFGNPTISCDGGIIVDVTTTTTYPQNGVSTTQPSGGGLSSNDLAGLGLLAAAGIGFLLMRK
jgi:hypothetical protein